MKDLMPSAWETFVATHRAGDTVRGKVTRFTSFGVFVELADGLEGLCHISELSDARVERPDDVAQIGQEMDFKILRIEYEDQKIGLSHRAVGKDDEPIVDTRMYTSEAKGGMASLAELANLKFGSSTGESGEEATPGASKKERRAARQAAAQGQAGSGEEATLAEDTSAAEPETTEAAVQQSGETGEESEAAVTSPESTEAQSEAADQEAQGGSLTEGEKSPEEENQNTEANGAAGE
jgi:predicted RNA-binding protein with RPS1 domain